MRSQFMVLWKTTWFKAVLGLLLFALGILVGSLPDYLKKPISISPIRDPISGYNFINPFLYSEVSESLSYPTYSPLKDALSNYATQAKSDKQVAYISIYYQDLNSGKWVGINPTLKFDPASMMKVTALIALLRVSEETPAILTDTVSIPTTASLPSGGSQSYYPPKDPVKVGNTYSVQDLLNRLIIQSDNGAAAVLSSILGDKVFSTVFTDLRIPLPGTSTGVSTQEYSHLFRVLYNSTYLTSADSEKALQLLSQTTFDQGLVAGVPTGTTVAHKFGESMSPPLSDSVTWPPPANQSDDVPGLSDCGIVYYPSHPYFLCVMTQGTDFPTLAGTIRDVSHLTWTQMDSLYSK